MASASQESAPNKIVPIGISNVYVPDGFTINDDAYVVVSGVFPNGCYHWGHADVVHKDAFHHEIQSYASVSPGTCIMVLIPFQKDVHLGHLDRGTHTLHFINGDGTYLENSLLVK